jgi:CRP/FNR family cyclic AMP-dependent transcriptional regulator
MSVAQRIAHGQGDTRTCHKKIDYQLLASSGYPIQEVAAGDVIFSKGNSGDRMCIVREGEVEISRDGKVIANVGHNEIFGEMALVDGSPRSATAGASNNGKLVAVNERGFIFLVSETPYFAINVMRTMADRIRTMNQLI